MLNLTKTRESLRDETHELRLGYNIGWNISHFLPEVIDKCRETYDDFSVRIECLSFEALMNKLQSGQLDAVLSLDDYMQGTSELGIEYEVVTEVDRSIIYSHKLLDRKVNSPRS